MTNSTMHADIHEFVCMYTPSLTQKKKDWHDGYIKWHMHNYRTALYDINRNPVCFKFFPGKTIEADSELNFDRYLVEVKEQTDTMQANLENVIRKPTNTPARQAALARRMAGSVAGTLNTPAPRTPLYGAPSKRIYPPCMSQTPLHARHIAVEPRVMVPITPKPAPLSATRKRKLDGMLGQKDSVLVQRTLPRTPASQARSLMPSTVKSKSALGQANRTMVASPSRSPSSSPEPMPKARLKAQITATKMTIPAAPASIRRPTAQVTEPILIDLDDDDHAHDQAERPPDRLKEAPQARRPNAVADQVRIVSLTRKKRCLLSALKPKPAPESSPRSPPRVRSASPHHDAVASFAPSPEHARSPSPVVQAPGISPDCVMLTSAPRPASEAARKSPDSSLEVLSRPVTALAESAKAPRSQPKSRRKSPDPSLEILSLPAAPDGLLSKTERLAEHREKQRLAMEAALTLGREMGLLSAEPGTQTGAVDADEAFEKAWEAFEADETQDAPHDIEDTSNDVHADALPIEEDVVMSDAQDVADTEVADADEADDWSAIQGPRSEGFSQFVEKLLSSQGQGKLSSAESAEAVGKASRRAVAVGLDDDSAECPATAPEAIQPMVPETDLMDLQQDTLSIPCTAVPSSNTRHANGIQAQAAREASREQFKHLLAAEPVAVLQKTIETDGDGFLVQSERKRKRSPAKSKKKKRLQMTVVEAVEKQAGKFDHLLAGYQFSQQHSSQQEDDGWQIPLATAPVQQQLADAEMVEQIGQETDEDDEDMDTTQERHIQQHLNAAARRIAAQSTLSRLNPQHYRGQARKKPAGKALHTISRERLVAAATGHAGQQGPAAQVQASVSSRPGLPDRHPLQEMDEQSVNAMRSMTAATDGNVNKVQALQAPVSNVVRRRPPARRVLHQVDDDDDLAPALAQVKKSLSVSVAAAGAAPPPRIRTGLSRQGSLLSRPTSAKSITTAPMPVEETLEHEAGVVLATQLARRAPDFMSAKSHHAGAVLGLDAPLAALKGMSARDLAAMTDCTQEMADA